MNDPSRSVDEKIEDLIHSLLDRATSASPRDTHALACAVRELYGCQELARANKEADWFTQLTGGGAEVDLTPDFLDHHETTC